jgi:hypothetical protein
MHSFERENKRYFKRLQQKYEGKAQDQIAAFASCNGGVPCPGYPTCPTCSPTFRKSVPLLPKALRRFPDKILGWVIRPKQKAAIPDAGHSSPHLI